MKKIGKTGSAVCYFSVMIGVLGSPVLTSRATEITAEMIKQGQAIYQDNCGTCHGVNLEGEANWRSIKSDGTLPAPPHDESGHTWHHSDKVLFDYVKKGGGAVVPGDFKSGMPPFADILSDDEILAVLGFLKSRWSPRAQKYQRQISAASQ